HGRGGRGREERRDRDERGQREREGARAQRLPPSFAPSLIGASLLPSLPAPCSLRLSKAGAAWPGGGAAPGVPGGAGGGETLPRASSSWSCSASFTSGANSRWFAM